MKCLKHLISFLLYLNLLSLCSTTRSPFNRTRRWHVLKSSVIAIEKHCFRPLKILTLAPKKIAFVQGLFQPSPILIFSFDPTSFAFAPHLLQLRVMFGVILANKRSEDSPLFLSSKVSRNFSPFFSLSLKDLSFITMLWKPLLSPFYKLKKFLSLCGMWKICLAFPLVHPIYGNFWVGI